MKPLLRENVAQVTGAADGRMRENFGQATLAHRSREPRSDSTLEQGEP